MFNRIVPLVAVAALALAGCASSGGTKERTTTTNQPDPQTYDPGASSTYPDSIAPQSAVIGGATSPAAAAADAAVLAERSLSNNVIYFPFDSSDLTPDGQAVVTQYASYLAGSPAAKLRLEGHADERGTREYNVGLAERRANTVQSALLAAGASHGQLSVTSYGEERPADPGHTEDAWGKNRRVQLIRQ